MFWATIRISTTPAPGDCGDATGGLLGDEPGAAGQQPSGDDLGRLAGAQLVAGQHARRRHFALGRVAIGHDRADRAHIAFDRDPPGYAADLGHFHDQQHAIDEGTALAAKVLGHGDAGEPALFQRRHIVPRILFAAVDIGRARRNDALGQLAGAGLKGALVVAQNEHSVGFSRVGMATL